MRGFLLLIALLVCATSAGANDAHWLGHARLFTNDWLGDGQDRWRSGSYGVSLVRGREWNGRNPEHFGSLIEFRVRNEIIAPSNLADPVIGTDRPYAGILQFGVFSHLRRGKTDITLGLDLVATGPQTGIGFFQSSVHNFFGMDPVAILGSQIPNAIHPALSAAMARDFRLTHGDERRVVLRPFAEVEVGVENLVRVGGDLTFGDAGKGDFQVRDPSTGHRSTAIRGERRQGLSFLLGADVALVR
ncbi:MAG: lipid A-modifier LpxR family protein, partial [Paracoccaceae bacterium]